MRNLFIMLTICFALFSFESISDSYLPDIDQEISQLEHDVNGCVCLQKITIENTANFDDYKLQIYNDEIAALGFDLINSKSLPHEVGWRYS